MGVPPGEEGDHPVAVCSDDNGLLDQADRTRHVRQRAASRILKGKPPMCVVMRRRAGIHRNDIPKQLRSDGGGLGTLAVSF